MLLGRAAQPPMLEGIAGITNHPPRRNHLLLHPLPAARRRTWCSGGATRGFRQSWWPPAAAAPEKDVEEGGGGGGYDYERIPMDTPGAYRIVDRSTGRNVIVWGGAEDGDPLPSESALSLSLRRGGGGGGGGREPMEKKGVGRISALDDSAAKPRASVIQSAGIFGRLKAQKVKALIERSSRIKKENSRDTAVKRVGEATFDDADTLKGLDLGKRKTNSGFRQYAEMNSNVNYKENVDPATLHVDSGQHMEDDGLDMPASNVSSSKGWGNVCDITYGRQNQQRKTSSDSGFFSSKSFKDIGCTDDIVNSLRNLMFLRPSHIQAMAYGPVLEGKSCIIADQSGSGKTLAYLAPVIQSLRQEEILGTGKSSPRSPRVIILAPTAELASQVLNNCRSISKFGVPFRSMVATGGFRQKTQLDSLQQQLDVLIATPGRFFYLLQEGFVQLTNLRCVVFDEVDILFGEEGFEQVLQRLISVAPVSAQYLFVTATLPINIYNKVVEIFPDCEIIMGPGVHRTSSRLEEVLVDCSGDDEEERNPDTAFSNKKSALLQIVEESPVSKTIVFCNKIETCRKVENVLKRLDRKASEIKVLPFHAALVQESRLANFKEFLRSQTADSMFLVCTDRASRGIDFADVDHVVLFDFPRDPSEYVRRVGRTARGASGKGKAYVFVVGKQVSLARRIMERNRKGHPLHDVPCA